MINLETNYKKLEKGMRFKNQRALSEFLEEPFVATSRGRKRQKARWEEYFNYKIYPNRSFEILEVYEEPRPSLLSSSKRNRKKEVTEKKVLQKGTVYKNYRELCIALGATVYYEKAPKESQMRNWKQYFDFKVNSDKSIEILEIIGLPVDMKKISKKKTSKTLIQGETPKTKSVGIYVDHIEHILCYMLSQENDHSIAITKTDLLKKLGMIKMNYNNKRFRETLLSLLPYDRYKNERYLKNFKAVSWSRLNDILTSGLESLQKREIINYEEVYIVYDETGRKYIADKNIVTFIEQSVEATKQRDFLNSKSECSTTLNWRKFITEGYLKSYVHSQKIFKEQIEHEYISFKKAIKITLANCEDGKNNSLTKKTNTDTVVEDAILEEKIKLNKLTTQAVIQSLSSAKKNYEKKVKREQDNIVLGSIREEQTSEYRENHELYDDCYEEANSILSTFLLEYQRIVTIS